jgi:membrane protease YdiL (CAAX protease family)
MPAPDLATFAVAFELGLIGVGLLLLWRLVASPSARASRGQPRLGAWTAPGSDLLLFILLVTCGGILFQVAAVRVLAHTPLESDDRLIVAAALFQLGLLAGVAGFHLGFGRAGAAPPPAGPGALPSGAATFLITLPLLAVVTLAWQGLLGAFGLPVEKQDIIDLFANTQSNLLRGLVIVFAVVIAPITEELIFRRGLFRYLRGRVPRWVALGAPALLFGCLHVSWKSLDGLAALAPLTTLGVVFSIAYERTGRIGTTMVAHALFNLNTVVLILAGVNV